MDEFVSLSYIKELKGMILVCAHLYIPDTQVKAGGVVHPLISYGGSGCSVALEKPNANV